MSDRKILNSNYYKSFYDLYYYFKIIEFSYFDLPANLTKIKKHNIFHSSTKGFNYILPNHTLTNISIQEI